jgi:hypothetical protein
MTLDEYKKLITSEHNDKPKFMAMVNAGVQPLVKFQQILSDLPRDFDIDFAVGQQLDIVGKWIGRTRDVAIPLTDVYFSWGEPSVGWGLGSWMGPFDPASGLTRLPDDSYRILLKAKIAANSWDGTIPGAYEVWEEAFGNQSQIVIQDNQDMSMTVAIFGLPLDAITLALLTGGYIPLKPEGVRINSYDVAPDNGPIFAWGIDNDLFKGWGEGSWPMHINPD